MPFLTAIPPPAISLIDCTNPLPPVGAVQGAELPAVKPQAQPRGCPFPPKHCILLSGGECS